MTPPRRSLPSVPGDRRGALSQTAPSSTEKHQKSVHEKYEYIDSSATDSDLLTRTHIYIGALTVLFYNPLRYEPLNSAGPGYRTVRRNNAVRSKLKEKGRRSRKHLPENTRPWRRSGVSLIILHDVDIYSASNRL